MHVGLFVCLILWSVFAGQTVWVWGTEGLHCHPGLPSDNCERFLADGVAGEDACDRHDDTRGWKRQGGYQKKRKKNILNDLNRYQKETNGCYKKLKFNTV